MVAAVNKLPPTGRASFDSLNAAVVRIPYVVRFLRSGSYGVRRLRRTEPLSLASVLDGTSCQCESTTSTTSAQCESKRPRRPRRSGVHAAHDTAEAEDEEDKLKPATRVRRCGSDAQRTMVHVSHLAKKLISSVLHDMQHDLATVCTTWWTSNLPIPTP